VGALAGGVESDQSRYRLLTPTLTPTGVRFGAFRCASVRVIRIRSACFELGLDGFKSRLPDQNPNTMMASWLVRRGAPDHSRITNCSRFP
jgi:hypothetical protein